MKKQTTFYPKSDQIKEDWFLLDASEQILGRLASNAAKIVQGKNSRYFTPGCDMKNIVVIINADKIAVSGKKKDQKKYYRHTGYTGHLKTTTFKQLQSKRPEDIIHFAVKGMLPHNKYGSILKTKVKVYCGGTHPHQAQNPIKIN